ncbi:hypothetical protein MNBD_GAMMA26-2697 [hydrothermal vent metagenome]|uniref:ABC-type transport auxiliary lipoprotein component domain-containing protein n=1 Tax=hydrothermal vent metagenome TaxID=652676 RepID=A0A3B1BXV6_9ZZZZ
MQFERGPDEYVYLSVQWRISKGIGRVPLATQVSQLKSTGITTADDYDAIVAAMSDLFGQLSQVIAQAILKSAI